MRLITVGARESGSKVHRVNTAELCLYTLQVLSLRQVLALPELQAGSPELLHDAGTLDEPVRWVHVSELSDIAGLLRGGELILTTGIALPAGARALRRYAQELSAAGASGLVVELGRRWKALPPALVQGAEAAGLPLVALHRAVPFVAVTETVHATIVNAQYELLQRSEQAHRAFTGLAVEGATVTDIVARAAQMSGHAIVLEDLVHRAVVTAAGSATAAELLVDWELRSRATPGWDETGVAGPENWLVTPVGPRAHRWGRLVVPRPSPGDAALSMVLERAAEALALNRLLERDQASLEQQAHRALFTTLRADHALGRRTDEADVRARALALGLAVVDRTFLGVAVWSPATSALEALAAERRDRSLSEAVARAARSVRVSALVATVDPSQVLMLVSLPGGSDNGPGVLRRLAAAIDDELRSCGWSERHTVGVGQQASRLSDAPTSLALAAHVANVASSLSTGARPYYVSTDVRLRGLLAALRDEPRLGAFADAELDQLRAHDARHGTDLVGTLRAYLEARGNKSEMARTTHLSRPALYARLAKIARTLDVDLDDAESCLSLHVALLVAELRLRPGPLDVSVRERPCGRRGTDNSLGKT